MRIISAPSHHPQGTHTAQIADLSRPNAAAEMAAPDGPPPAGHLKKGLKGSTPVAVAGADTLTNQSERKFVEMRR